MELPACRDAIIMESLFHGCAMPLTPSAEWPEIPQWDNNTPLLGGEPDAPLNRQAQALGARTEFLKDPANIELDTRDYGVRVLSEWVQDLPPLTQPKGGDPVGGFDAYSKMRGYSGDASRLRVIGGGRVGEYVEVSGDSVTADDGGKIIVATDGRRFERASNGAVYVDWFEPSGSDQAQAIERALKYKHAQIEAKNYSITTPVKLPSLSKLAGQSSGMAFTGTTANYKFGISKTGKAPAAIKNFQTGVISEVDCILFIDPDWIDSGVSYPQKTALENVALLGDANARGLHIEQGGGFTLRNVDIAGCADAIFAKDAWTCILEKVHAQGVISWNGGTSLVLSSCWTGAGSSSHGGYAFASVNYSVMNACASDHATNTAYRFVNSSFVLNGCGSEGATTTTPDTGTAIDFAGGNDIIVNGFCCVPNTDQTNPIYSFGSDNNVRFIGGRSKFGSSSIAGPDIRVNGNGSTIIFEDYVFANGTKNSPVVSFAAGVSTSRVIVRYGEEERVYFSTGAGDTLSERKNDSGTWSPLLKIGGSSAGVAASYVNGKWMKRDKSVSIFFELELSSKGLNTGTVVLDGFPLFGQQHDAAINLSVLDGVTNGPFVGVVRANSGAVAIELMRSTPAGVVPVTASEITDYLRICGTLLYLL